MAIKYLSDQNPDGTVLGNDADDKIGFYGVAPIAQRSGAAQAAVTTTASTTTTPAGYATTTQADAIVTLVNELRAALVALGAIKGSA
jgi:UDP-N-acetyl-D-mannosaminuronic acid transferase (WecB/TagA/CpsF family)